MGTTLKMINDAYNKGVARKAEEKAAAQGHLDSLTQKVLDLTEELEKTKAEQTKAQATVDDLEAGFKTFMSEQEEEKSKNIAVAEEKKQIEYAAAEETITTAQKVMETREHDKNASAEANDKLDDDDKIKPTPTACKGPEGEIPCCCSIPSSSQQRSIAQLIPT